MLSPCHRMYRNRYLNWYNFLKPNLRKKLYSFYISVEVSIINCIFQNLESFYLSRKLTVTTKNKSGMASKTKTKL
jgi:hypothetical protein